MTADVLGKLFESYSQYYTVKTEGVEAPFAAEAEFSSHTEQYMLVKAAKIADIDSNEFVYFFSGGNISAEKIAELSSAAWNAGLAKTKPAYGHRNTDITLVVAAESLANGVEKTVRKIKFYKSYKFGFFGWSCFRLCVYDDSSRKCFTNRFGRDLQKLFISFNKNSFQEEKSR